MESHLSDSVTSSMSRSSIAGSLCSETTKSKRARKNNITASWFRQPVTDYVTLSNVSYPKTTAADAALERLERNELVSVFYQHFDPPGYFAKVIREQDEIFHIYASSEDNSSASTSTNSFCAFDIKDPVLLDILRPVMVSIHHSHAPQKVFQAHHDAPFSELFFAQGRIIELFQHGKLHSEIKHRLGLLLSIMQVILKTTNERVLELSKKRTITFRDLWTLYPKGGFVVSPLDGLPHIYQIVSARSIPCEDNIDNEAGEGHKKKKSEVEIYWPYKLQSFGFDGYNVGVYHGSWECCSFYGEWPVEALNYRPLNFEQKYVDSNIIKDAVLRGRKVLDLQGCHHLEYRGVGHRALTKRDEEANLNGRVMIDAKLYNIVDKEFGVTFPCCDHRTLPVAGKTEELNDQARALFDNERTSRPSKEQIEKRVEFYAAHEEYLMLMKPQMPGFSFDLNDWYWLDVSSLSAVEHRATSLFDNAVLQRSLPNAGGDVDARVRNLSNILGNFLSQPRQEALPILISGPRGIGKTNLVCYLAEHFQLPVLTITAADIASSYRVKAGAEIKHWFRLAREWGAMILVEQAQNIDAFTSRYDSEAASNATVSSLLKQHSGVVFVTTDHPRAVGRPMANEFAVSLQLPKLTPAQQSTVWEKIMIDELRKVELDQDKIVIEKFKFPSQIEDTLRTWKLNGHQIRRICRNVVMSYQSDGQIPTLSSLQAMKEMLVPPVVKRKNKKGKKDIRRRRRYSSSDDSDSDSDGDGSANASDDELSVISESAMSTKD